MQSACLGEINSEDEVARLKAFRAQRGLDLLQRLEVVRDGLESAGPSEGRPAQSHRQMPVPSWGILAPRQRRDILSRMPWHFSLGGLRLLIASAGTSKGPRPGCGQHCHAQLAFCLWSWQIAWSLRRCARQRRFHLRRDLALKLTLIRRCPFNQGRRTVHFGGPLGYWV